MSEGSISQEEIDALLSGVDMGGLSGAVPATSAGVTNIDVPTLEKFSAGIKDRLAENLKNFTSADCQISTPIVEVSDRDQLLSKIPEVIVAVMADYSTALTGDHLFILSNEFAQKVVALVNKEDEPAIDDMALSLISEAINMHSSTEIDELAKSGKLPGLATNVPEAVNQPKAMIRMPQGKFALFTYPITLDGNPYTLWEAVSGSVGEGMTNALGGGQSAQPAQNAAMNSGFQAQPMGMGQMNQMGGMGMPMGGMNQMGGMGMQMGGMNQMGGMPMQQMPMQQPMNNMGMGMMQSLGTPPNVQQLSYPNLQPTMAAGEQGNIGLIMDVFMEVTVELGRCKKTIKEILGMGEGTIIELDKLAGEPVDILVNHKAIAKGEVVVIDENFGVRVTEILPTIEHVTSQM